MKAILAALALTFCAQPVWAQGKKALDEKYGFRDMKFETEVSAFPDLVESASDNPAGPQKFYRRPADDLKVGDAILSSIGYEFYNGKLRCVTLRTEGTGNSVALQNALRAQYGPGSPPLKITEESMWTSSKVRMYYRRNYVSGDSYVRISSKLMDKEAEKGSEAAAKSAKSDL